MREGHGGGRRSVDAAYVYAVTPLLVCHRGGKGDGVEHILDVVFKRLSKFI